VGLKQNILQTHSDFSVTKLLKNLNQTISNILSC